MVIKFARQSRYSRKWTIFVETSGTTYKKLINQKLDIGWGYCHVYEDLKIKKCFKCCNYGHKTTECKNEQICSLCAGKHDRKNCTSKEKICVNCSHVKNKYDATRQTDHDSNTEECPIMANKIRIARERVNYEAILA